MNVRAAWSSIPVSLVLVLGMGFTSATQAVQVTPTSLTLKVGASGNLALSDVAGRASVVVDKPAFATTRVTSRSAVNVRAVAPGAATVRISDRNGSVSVPVTVTPAIPMTVAPSSLTVAAGNTAAITVSNPDGTVTVASSNPAIATVSYATGVAAVKGVAAGSATVTVKDGSTTRTVVVAVVAPIALTPSYASVTAGTTAKFTVGSFTGTVTVTSSDSMIATVTYAGGVAAVTGVKVGSATITARDAYSSAVSQVSVVSSSVPTLGGFALLAWNDLGMHCVDGKDYSVFSILPPYNNLHAQLVDKTTGKQVTSGVTLTYESIPDTTLPPTDPLYKSINTISSTKTNFWTWVGALFGASPAPDVGLNLSGLLGNRTPSLSPQPMSFAATNGWFVAEGLPITPVDDQGRKNFYPMVKVTARNAAGQVLATARTVLPVSDEMTCVACHKSTTSTNTAANAAKPKAGWVFDPAPEKDWKKNILLLHDEKMFDDPTTSGLYRQALAAMGYDPAGLLQTVGGRPVLCASCHSSNALATGGYPKVRALTHALHTRHATAVDPASMQTLTAIDNRTACYACHPGSVTQCLRGVMGNARDSAGNLEIDCQSCHGNMTAVGNTARTGWLSQPTCQACHHDGAREIEGVAANGLPKTWADTRFASNPNTPAAGYSLYRFSKGHGNLQCEACHGATHAEYPSSHSQDNALSIDLQGFAGPISDCKTCHATVPNTTSGGPHGMHTVGASWVTDHHDVVTSSNVKGCLYCHGSNATGSPLATVKVAKTFDIDDGRTRAFGANERVTCWSCHNGPNP
jgi:hypothetical protein